MIRLINPELVFLSETRCSVSYLESLKAKWNYHGIVVDKVGLSGGLALLWRKEVDARLLSFSQNHIDTEVVLPRETLKWRFTGFYGFPEQHHRSRSWNILCLLHSRSSLPWVVGGDFNEILADEEKTGGVRRPQAMMEAFRDGLSDCGLSDLGFSGQRFTWSNNRVEPNTVRCRLDRFCCTGPWREYAPSAQVEHLGLPGSDHVPVLLRIKGHVGGSSGRKRQPWRFNAHWIRKEECEEVIKYGWNAVVEPDCFEKLFHGISACQMGLRQWFGTVHNNPRKHIENLKK